MNRKDIIKGLDGSTYSFDVNDFAWKSYNKPTEEVNEIYRRLNEYERFTRPYITDSKISSGHKIKIENGVNEKEEIFDYDTHANYLRAMITRCSYAGDDVARTYYADLLNRLWEEKEMTINKHNVLTNYWNQDIKAVTTEFHIENLIEKVIFNEPATIVIWKDGTKTVVKVQEGEEFNPYVGLAMCISKKAMGNKGNYFNVFKKWCAPYVEEQNNSMWAQIRNEFIKMLSPSECFKKPYTDGTEKIVGKEKHYCRDCAHYCHFESFDFNKRTVVTTQWCGKHTEKFAASNTKACEDFMEKEKE